MRVFDTGIYVYDWDKEHFEYPFIIAEYLPKTLASVVQESNASLPEKISYMMQLLSALDYLHSLRPEVIHRDIKPSNVFVKGNSCVLGDFGLLKVLGKEEASDPKIYLDSLDGRIPWLYRSPDLVKYARGKGELTTKSDVYQAGLVACELFTGHLPIAEPRKMLDDVVFTHIPKIHGAFGPRLGSLIKLMLTHNPNDRPTAYSLLRSWEAIFWDAVEKTHELDGHAFRTRI
jgi:serine/threonine protein kinase